MVAIVAGAGLGLVNSSLTQVGSGGIRGDGTLGQTGGQATVNIATGNLILQYTDETLSGSGADLHYLRTYNSQGSLYGANQDADGWREGGFKRLEVLAGQINTVNSGGISRYLSDGSRSLYSFDESENAYFSPDGAGAHDKIQVVNADGSELTQPLQYDQNGDVIDPQNYLWVWSDGRSKEYYQFEGNHLILQSRDTSGNGFDYTYGGDGTRLESVTDLRSGQTFTYEYGTSGNEDGRLTAVKTSTTASGDQTGQVYYSYDTDGRLHTVTMDLSPDNDITDGNVYSTTYTYDGASARVATISHSDGSTVAITYQDINGVQRVHTVADQNGLTTFGYDTVNRTTTVTNQEGETWTYTYDAQDRLTDIESTAVNGAVESTHFSYNENDDLIQITDGKGNAVNYYYDSRGNRLREVDAEGNYIVKTYSYKNDLLTETRYTSASQTPFPAAQVSIDDPLPALPSDLGEALTTHYIYDTQQRLRFTVSAEGRVTENQYNAFGQLENTIAYDGTFAPEQLDTALDFSQFTHSTFVNNENISDQVTVLENGAALRLDNNTWIAIPHATTITERTILEFDFESTAEGEHHTIGFTNSLTSITHANHFKVYGTQSTSTLNTDYEIYQAGDGTRHFRIPVGEYFTGSFANLAFISDDDANVLASSTFSNVRIYDEDALQAAYLDQLTAWTDSADASTASQTQFNYDTRGNVSRQVTYATFDESGEGIVDDAASVKEYLYDQHGQLLNEIIVRGEHRTQEPQQNIFADSAEQDRHFYDDQQRLRFVISVDGQVIEHRYDSVTGNLSESIAYEGQFPIDSLGDTLSFNGATFVDFGSGENISDDYSVTGTGEGLTLSDNTWKAIELPYTVTENTWLEFDFSSSVQGDHHTIGFANSLTAVSYENHFKLYGSQSNPALNTNYQTYDGSGDTVHYRIPVGQYFTGAFQRLAFINDDDANLGAQSVFENVRLYEEAPAVDGASEIAVISTWTQSAQAQAAYLTAFEYNGDTTLEKRTDYTSVDASGAGVLDYSTTVTDYVYDGQGALVSETASLALDTKLRTTINSFTYDGVGRLLTTSNASGTTTNVYNDSARQIVVTNQAGLTTTQTFDTRGQLQTIHQSDASETRTTSYMRDAAGRLRMTEDSEGGRTWTFYNDAGRVSHRVARDGAVTEYAYDENGQLVTETHYANRVDLAATASWHTGSTDWWTDSSITKDELVAGVDYTTDSGQDRVTHYQYDDAGRLIKTTDAALLSNITTYDGLRVVSDQTGVDVDTSELSLWSQLRAEVSGEYSDTALYYLVTKAIGEGETEQTFLNTLQASSTAQIDALFAAIDHLGVEGARQTRYFYDDDGLQLGSLDAEGYLVENIYDGVGRLTATHAYELQVTDPVLINGDFGDLLTYVQTESALTSRYFYDGLGRQVATLNEQGFLSTTTYDQANNQRTETTYLQAIAFEEGDTLQDLVIKAVADDGQSLASVTQFDAFGRTQTVTSIDGTISRNIYDQAGRLVRTIFADGTDEQRSTRTVYNEFNEITGTLGGVGDATLSANPSEAALNTAIDNYGTRYTLDGLGRRIQSRDANGNVTLFYYDTQSRLTHTVNALGEVTATTYNAFGQVDSVRTYAGRIDTTGLTGGVSDAALQLEIDDIADSIQDSVESYFYDSRGLLVQTVRPEGATTDTRHNLFGETVRKTTTDTEYNFTARTEFVRDKLGQVIEQLSGVDANQNIVTHTQYDAFGRITQSTDANGHTTTTQYLSGGREIVVTDPLSRITRTQFDALGRTLKSYDGFNNATTFTYDDAGRSTTVTTPEGIQVTTVNNRHGETFTVTDGRGGITTYQYNEDGQLLTVVDAEDNTIEENIYENSGRLFQTVDGNGTVTEFNYDNANRVFERIVDPTGLALKTEYQFNGKGERTFITEGAGTSEAKTTEYRYDREGQTVRTIVDPDGLQLTTTFSYDAQGNTRRMERGDLTDPSQEVTEYTYDLLGRRTSETVDPAGLAIQTEYRYDNNGNVTRRIDANGNSTWFLYDNAGQNILEINAEGSLTQHVYDLNGRVVATRRYANEIDTAGLAGQDVITLLPTVPLASDDDQLTYYVYDADGRERFVLSATDNQNGVTRWTVAENRYDANNNIVETLNYGQYLTSDMINDFLAESGLSQTAIYSQLYALAHEPATSPIPGIEFSQSTDIGQVNASGSTQYNSVTGVYTVSGSGENIFDREDEFHYAYTEIQGDFDARVRVSDITQSGTEAKAGLMIRNSLSGGSAHASAYYLPGDNSAAFQSRNEASGLTSNSTMTGYSSGAWLRLVREGDTVTAYSSNDGEFWIQLGTQTVSLEESVRLGLAVSSLEDGSLAQATFDSLEVWNGKVAPPQQDVVGIPAQASLADNVVTETRFIGGEDARGSTQYNAATGTFSVSGAGTRFSGPQDSFQFAYVPVAGDFDAQVRVTDIETAHYWTRVGLMLRDDLTQSSTHASTLLTVRDVAYQSRASIGASASTAGTSSTSVPTWLRLAREGDTFTSYSSSDGVNWTQIGSSTISLSSEISYLGIAVTSANVDEVIQAQFDNFSVTGEAVQFSQNYQPEEVGFTDHYLPVNGLSEGAMYEMLNAMGHSAGVTGGDSAGPVAAINDDAILGNVEGVPTAPNSQIDSFSGPAYWNISDPGSVAWTGDHWTVDGDTFLVWTPTEFEDPNSWAVGYRPDVVNISITAPTSGTFPASFSIYLVDDLYDGISTSYDIEVVSPGQEINVSLPTDFANSAGSDIHALQIISSFGESDWTVNKVEFVTDAEAGQPANTPTLADNVLRSTASIGDVEVEGGAQYDTETGTYTVQGSGSYILHDADEFQFVYEPIVGDFDAKVRVKSIDNIETFSGAGLMIRDSLDAGATQVSSLLTAGEGGMAIARVSPTVSSPVLTEGYSGEAWVRLTREGDIYTSYISHDGENWELMASWKFEFASEVSYLGLAVTAHHDGLVAEGVFDNFSVVDRVVKPIAKPVGGTQSDQGLTDGVIKNTAYVGTVLKEGTAQYDGNTGTYTITGSGGHIIGAEDEFQFTFEPVVGDFDARARVESVEQLDEFTAAGLMVRDTLQADSLHVSTLIRPGTTDASIARISETAGYSVREEVPSSVNAEWVRITRVGDIFTSYVSEDGANWITVRSYTVDFGSEVAYLGFAVTSHENGELATAVFDNFTVTGEAIETGVNKTAGFNYYGQLDVQRTAYSYDANNRLKTVTDAEDNQSQNFYDARGNLTRTIDANGNSIWRTYNTASQLTHVINAEGEVTKYSYDNVGRLHHTREFYNRVNVSALLEQNVVTNFSEPVEHAEDRRNFSIHDKADRERFTLTATDVDTWVVTENRFDDMSRVTQATRYGLVDMDDAEIDVLATPSGVSNTDYQITAIQFQNNALPLVSNPIDTFYAYDDAGRLRYTVKGAGYVEENTVTENIYDDMGNITYKVNYRSPYLQTTSVPLSYTEADLQTAFHAKDDLETGTPDTELYSFSEYRYDALSRLTDEFSPHAEFGFDNTAGRQRTRYEYNAFGQLSTKTVGILATATNENASPGRATEYLYDRAGRTRFIINASEILKENRYDVYGNLEYDLTYDLDVGSAARNIESLEALRANAALGDESTRGERYQYDQNNRLISTTDALLNTEEYAYDAVGNRIWLKNKNNDVWRYYYDSQGRLEHEVSSAVQVMLQGASSPTDRHLVRTMEYNAFGEVTSLAEGRTLEWVDSFEAKPYGSYGGAVFSPGAVSDSESRTTDYSYDRAGRQTLVEKPGYYIAGGLGLIYYGSGGGGSAGFRLSVETTYDGFGNAVRNKTRVAQNDYQYEYKVYDIHGRVIYDIDAEYNYSEYQYDAVAQTEKVIRYGDDLESLYAEDVKQFLADDIENHISTATGVETRGITTRYDNLGRKISTKTDTTDNNFLSVESNPDNNDSMTAYSAQAETLYHYDTFNQLVRERARINNAEWADTNYYYDTQGRRYLTVDALRYGTKTEYDAFGNVTGTIEYAALANMYGGAPPVYNENHTKNREMSFYYDALNRRTHTYSHNGYDSYANGEFTRNDTAVYLTQYNQYDNVGNLISQRDTYSNTIQTDAYGNTTQVDNNGNTTVYSYNALGQLHYILDAERSLGGNAANPTVDPFYNPDTGTVYTSYRLDVFGNIVREETGNAVDETRFIHHEYDHLGNEVRTIDAEGNIIDREFDAFGRVVREQTAVGVSQIPNMQIPDPVPGQSGETDFSVHDLSYWDSNQLNEWEYPTTQNNSQAYLNVIGNWADEMRPAAIEITINGRGQNGDLTIEVEAGDVIGTQTLSINAQGDRFFTIPLDFSSASSGITQIEFHPSSSANPPVNVSWAVTEIRFIGVEYVNGEPPEPDPFIDLAGQGVYDTSYNYDIVREFHYDRVGRQTATIDLFDANLNDTDTTLTRAGTVQTYNAFGEVMLEERIRNTNQSLSSGERSIVNSYDYDAAGRLERSQGSSGIVDYFYDLRGNVTRKEAIGDGTLANNQKRITEYYYDELGRVLRERAPSHLAISSDFGTNATVLTPTIEQTYDRWGNVTSLTSAANFYVNRVTTNYEYNNRNQLIEVILPETDVMQYSGSDVRMRPEQHLYYDILGNRIGEVYTEDNGTVLRQRRNEYDNIGQLVATHDATGHTVRYAYDGFGNRIATRDANGVVTIDTYNANNQITSRGVLRNTATSTEWVNQATSGYNSHTDTLTADIEQVVLNTWLYDQAGRRFAEIDARGYADVYRYDARGNIIRHKNRSDIVIDYTYNQDGLKTETKRYMDVGGMGQENEEELEKLTFTYSTEDYEFGRAVGKTTSEGKNPSVGYEGKAYTLHYNAFGQLERESLGANYASSTYIHYNYLRNGLVGSIQDFASEGTEGMADGADYVSADNTTEFAYDIRGNRVLEKHQWLSEREYVENPSQYSEAELRNGTDLPVETLVLANTHRETRYRFDEHNRLAELRAPAIGPDNETRTDLHYLTHHYDALGNRVLMTASYTKPGGTSPGNPVSYWNAYDDEGRVTVERGVLHDSNADGTTDMVAIKGGAYGGGVFHAYDAVGRQISTESVSRNGVYQNAQGNYEFEYIGTNYKYSDTGLLTSVSQGYHRQGNLVSPSGSEIKTTKNTTYSGLQEKESHTYHNNGFRTSSEDEFGKVTQMTYERDGRLQSQETRNSSGALTSQVHYTYDDGGNLQNYVTTTRNGSNWETFTYSYRYNYTYSGYKNIGITVEANQHADINQLTQGNTVLNYDHRGNLVRTSIDKSNGHLNQKFNYDSEGQLLTKIERRYVNGAYNDPRSQDYYYSGANAVANIGDFGANINPIGSTYAGGSTPGGYTISAGDTLQSIAQAVYGDSSLWYVLADANGLALGPTDAFTQADAGRPLNIPNTSQTLGNNSTTFKPFNLGDAIGDVTPAIQVVPPPSPKGCSPLVTIVLVVVAVIVTIYTAGAFANAAAASGSTVGTAAGTTAASGGLVATSSGVVVGSTGAAAGTWAAGVGALSGSIGGLSAGTMFAASFAGGFAGSVASQLVGKELGAVEHFSLRSAIASGFGAGFSSVAGGAIRGSTEAAGLIKAGELTTKGLFAQSAAGYVGSVAGNALAGLDTGFSWRAMAANTLATTVGTEIGNAANFDGLGPVVGGTLQGFLNGSLAAGINRGLGGESGDIGYAQIAIDAFGNALANSFVEVAINRNNQQNRTPPPLPEQDIAREQIGQVDQSVAQLNQQLSEDMLAQNTAENEIAAREILNQTEQRRNEESIQREVAVINATNDYRFNLDAKNQQFSNRLEAQKAANKQMRANIGEDVGYAAALSGAQMDQVRKSIGTDLSDVIRNTAEYAPSRQAEIEAYKDQYGNRNDAGSFWGDLGDIGATFSGGFAGFVVDVGTEFAGLAIDAAYSHGNPFRMMETAFSSDSPGSRFTAWAQENVDSFMSSFGPNPFTGGYFNDDLKTSFEFTSAVAGLGPLTTARNVGSLQRLDAAVPNSKLAFSRSPSEMIIQGADGVEGQIIKSKHLYRELNSSSIGRETLELIDQNNIDVVLSYGRPLSQKPGYTTFGVNYDNTAVAYVTNTVSKQKTASTIIHEVTHAAGTRGSQRAEVIAEIRALKHTQEASYSDIRSIIERVKIDYSDLPYRKYPVGQGNH